MVGNGCLDEGRIRDSTAHHVFFLSVRHFAGGHYELPNLRGVDRLGEKAPPALDSLTFLGFHATKLPNFFFSRKRISFLPKEFHEHLNESNSD